ncbi:hypothetical protein [Thiorhodovibrio frisius]|uniref:hypothetical protein n=1 Tax=Thiorhodovibrio frisius TaxID=631362 RepID=UPI00022C77C0|nr:hypothetical protein [Thiorhodovibrio frisius]WPL20321.1 hypothetical protein Thiofri_00401 [Thiorhodovibrio frisius]
MPPLTLARGSSDVQYLASPVTGGGVNRFEQLFLLAQRQGHKTRSDWARITWQVRQSQGQRQLKDGRPMESAEDNLAELTREAETFAEKRLAILQALGMV